MGWRKLKIQRRELQIRLNNINFQGKESEKIFSDKKTNGRLMNLQLKNKIAIWQNDDK